MGQVMMPVRMFPVRMFMDVMMLARARLAGQMNVELRRRNPAAINAPQAQLISCDAEFQQLTSQQFEIESAIEHRADEHVAARACETVQIKRFCHAPILHRALQLVLADLDLHSKQRGAERLALRVGLQRDRAAAAQTVMQQEIERFQIGQFVAFDFAFADSGEVPFDALGGDFADEDRVMLGLERDQADVGRVAFVARPRMSDFDKLYLHNII
jgi:hypothetical protein